MLALLSFLLLISWAHGQTAPAAQSAPEPTAPVSIVSASVDEVSLDLVVHDKKGKPVLDLKPADIAVSDDDTAVTLKGLHLVNGQSTAGHLITLVFDPMDGPAAKNAQDIAGKILKMTPKGDFSFAVLTQGARLRLVQGFTGDRRATEQAVNVATLEGPVQQGIAIGAAEKTLIGLAQTGVDQSGAHVSLKERAVAQTLLSALEGSQRIVQDQHTRPSLAGLLAMARSQQQLLERKTIIYFTLNGQLDSDAKAAVHAIIGAANRAGVSMYTVDLNGVGAGVHNQLMTMMVMGNIAGQNPVGTPGRGGVGDAGGAGVGSMIANTTTRFEGDGGGTGNASPLAGLAVGTGGAYIDGQDSVKKPLEQMYQDMTTYYEATYSPPIQEYDGKFRTIAVKPLRVGLKIQSKAGYFALPPGGGEGIRPFEAPLLKTLSEQQLPTDLNFRATILRMGDLPDGNTNTVVVEAPLSDLGMREDERTNLYTAHVSIVAQIKDKSGTVIEHFGEDLTRHGSLDAIDQAKTEAFTLQRHFIAAPGKYVLEAAIIDGFNGRAAAQRIDFEIPETPAGPSLSDLVLARQVEAFRADADPLEPLKYENAKVTPNLSTQVPPSAKSVSVFFIMHPDPQASDPAKLDMEILRNGKPAGHTTLPLRQGTGKAAVPYLATFQTSSLAPGFYAVKTTLTQGGKTAERELSFIVLGSEAASAGTDANANGPAAGADVLPAGELVITVPANPVPPPTQSELQAMIADARKRAVSYADSLPNFMCVEVTDHSNDLTGKGEWKHKETVTQMLRYRDKNESRDLLQVDGKPASGDSAGAKNTTSHGEFGGVLDAIFGDSSKADMQWKETDALGTGTVQVFNYKVAHDNSNFVVTASGNDQRTVSFHGQVFIDSATRSVRRVTLIADDLEKDFPIHATSIAVDYDYVVLNAHDYLMPISAEVGVRQGRREANRLEIAFKDYRRYGSAVKILDFKPIDKP